MFLMNDRMFAEARPLACGLRLKVRADRPKVMGFVMIVDLLFFRIVVGIRPDVMAEPVSLAA